MITNILDEPSSPAQFSENESLFGPDSDLDPDWDIQNESEGSSDDDNCDGNVQDDISAVEIGQNRPGTSVQESMQVDIKVVEIDQNHPGTSAQIESVQDDISAVEINRNRPETNVQLESNVWHPIQDDCHLNEIPFNPDNLPLGINHDIIDTMMDCSPLEFWQLFVTDELIKKLVLETNRYAEQQKASREVIPPNARIRKWVDCDESEMRKFLGIYQK